ncbi:hypothetical protein QGN29_11855 [Temperatibacter marinus]|uniref:Uncharacterized protein n=1 Tax=Temperatibacter marinus TaxID=1456591 RepID=A0AA52EGA5_9PROT|nr:hypothetical protein [Temperatibacter marinus]WND02245.1 hypothetical protein QGN29_11855 [Temperatibacter marinus]
MKHLIVPSLIVLMSLSMSLPSLSIDDRDQDRKIRQLEEKVRKLERELKELRLLVYEKFNLESKSKAPDLNPQASCKDQLVNFRTQKADLLNNGYRDKHPYIAAVSRTIKSLEKTCGHEVDSMSSKSQ